MKKSAILLCMALAFVCACLIQESETPFEEDFIESGHSIFLLHGDQILFSNAVESSVFSSQNTGHSAMVADVIQPVP